MINGLAGYFEAVLYGDIKLSIRPEDHSPEMFSWFPIFFPLKEPILASEGTEIIVSIWRESDSQKCWYEWQVDVQHGEMLQFTSEIYNVNGRSSWASL